MLLSFDLNRKASKTQSGSFRGFLFFLEVDINYVLQTE